MSITDNIYSSNNSCYNNNDNKNNNKLPNYLIKPILTNYINYATSNILVLETIYIISQTCKEWKDNILPKIIYKKFNIRSENSFYQLFFIMTRFNVDFQSITMDLEVWPNVRSYLIDCSSSVKIGSAVNVGNDVQITKRIDDELTFINLNDNCNKNLKMYFYQNKEIRYGFLSKFQDKVSSLNLLCYVFEGFELLEFRNVKKVTFFIDHDYPISSFFASLETLFDRFKQEKEREREKEKEKEKEIVLDSTVSETDINSNNNSYNYDWFNTSLKMIQIYSDDNLDFSNSTLRKFFKGLKNIESLSFSSYTNISLKNISSLLEYQSGNSRFKRLYFNNCSIPRDELYQLYQNNQTIETLNLNGILENGVYNDAIIPLSTDNKIKEFTLFNDYPTILNLSIISNVLNSNKSLSTFSIYTIVSDDTNGGNNSGNIDGDDSEIVIVNESLINLGLSSKTDRIVFEKGCFKNLKNLKCSVSEKVVKNLSKYNKESLESLFLFDTTDSSVETKKNFELLTSGYQDNNSNNSIDSSSSSNNNNGHGFFSQFKKLKRLNISLTEKSTSVNWAPLFKSITSKSLLSLNELDIESTNPIDEVLISDFFLSNHPTIVKIKLSLKYKVRDWSLVLDPICRNSKLTSISIQNSTLNTSNYNYTRSFIDIIQNNNTLESLYFFIRDSTPNYSHSDLSDLSAAILSNDTLRFLQFPYNLNKNPLVLNSIKYKLIKSNLL